MTFPQPSRRPSDRSRSSTRDSGKRACVFCGGEPVTREHVFPFWLREAVGGGGAATHYRLAPEDAVAAEATDYKAPWTAPEAEVAVRAVCAPCNNTWLNDLDHAVEPLIVPLIRNRTTPLDEEARTLLATWSAKIALLLEHTRAVSDLTRRRSLVPPVAFRELYKLRLPPAFARMWMLRVSPPVVGVWWRTGPVPVAWLDPEAARQIGAPNGSLTTFVAGMLGFQLLYAPLTEPYEDLIRRRTDLGAKFMRVLWPPRAPLEWPPEAALGRDTLDTFARLRFS